MLNIKINGKFIPKESVLFIDTDSSYLGINGEVIKECRIYLKIISGGMNGVFGRIEPYYIPFTGDEDIERLKERLKLVMQGRTVIQNFILETPTETEKAESRAKAVFAEKSKDGVQLDELRNTETETVTCDCLGSFIVDKKNKNYPIVQCPFCEKEFTAYQGGVKF